MIQQATIKQTMLSKLETYTGLTLVPSNTTKTMPEYPYCTFTILNTDTKKGTYGEYFDTVNNATVKKYAITATQKWSFTVQSDDDDEALEKAMLIKDFFDEAKRLELADNNIIVADVGGITPRDNMLTVEYEYRKGLDVTLRLNNIIADTNTEVIDKVTINEDITIEKE